jgi:hypothetical protein
LITPLFIQFYLGVINIMRSNIFKIGKNLLNFISLFCLYCWLSLCNDLVIQRNILIKTLFELLWYHSGCFVIQICCMLSYMTLLQRDDTTLCDKICQWLAAGRWFSPGTTVSSTNKTYRHNITEILYHCDIKEVQIMF